MLQAHGDCVVSLPNGATLLGSSATAPVEMFALGEDVLAVQGHPELDAGAMLANIAPRLCARALRRRKSGGQKQSAPGNGPHHARGRRARLPRGDGSGSVEAGANADGGDQTGKEQTDTPETLRRHAEAARAALSDTKRVESAEANGSKGSKGSAASAASGAATAAGAASVATSADQPSRPPLPPPNVRLAKREPPPPREDAFHAPRTPRRTRFERVVSHEFATLARRQRSREREVAELGGTVAGLGVFADSLRRKDSSVAPRFAELDAVEANLDALEQAAGAS